MAQTNQHTGGDLDPRSFVYETWFQQAGHFLPMETAKPLVGIRVAGGITNPCWLYGGDGNDRMKGGSGNNVLVGGAGDDLLVGGSNRDILVGGTGADRLVGNEAA